jgi:hypothetical protein
MVQGREFWHEMAENGILAASFISSAMSLVGPKSKWRDVRDLVAIGLKADMKRTSSEDWV